MSRLRQPSSKPRQLKTRLGISSTDLAVVGVAVLCGSAALYTVVAVIAQLPLRQGEAAALPPASATLTAGARSATPPGATSRPTASAAPLSSRAALTVAATVSAPSATSAASPTASQTSPTASAAPAVSPTPSTTTAPATDTQTATTTQAAPMETPTGTSAPTATPAPTPTATPSLAAGWLFTRMRQQADTSANIMVVYGLAVNNTGSAQQINQITGVFSDAQGQTLANPSQVSGLWPIAVAPAGGWTPFELTISGLSQMADAALSVDAQPSDQAPRQDFEFADPSPYTRPDQYCVKATFKNNGSDLGSYLKIIVVLFDNGDNVINFSDTYQPDDLDLAAGGQSLALNLCADTLGQSVARYEIQGWGR